MLVPLLKEQNKLPELFLNVLPEYCDCGFPYEITTTLSEMRCSNPKCPTKIKKRTEAMLNNLGITEISASVISRFVDKFNAQDPYLIFGYSYTKDGVLGEGISIEESKTVQELLSKRNRLTLGDFLLFANMPDIDSSIRILGEKYNSLQELYDNLNIENLTKLLGYTYDKKTLNSRVLKVYKTLITYRQELVQNIHLINLVTSDKVHYVHVACDEITINGYNNIEDFVAEINNIQQNYYIILSRLVYPSTKYYLTNSKDSINRQRADIVGCKIMTTDEFYKALIER